MEGASMDAYIEHRNAEYWRDRADRQDELIEELSAEKDDLEGRVAELEDALMAVSASAREAARGSSHR